MSLDAGEGVRADGAEAEVVDQQGRGLAAVTGRVPRVLRPAPRPVAVRRQRGEGGHGRLQVLQGRVHGAPVLFRLGPGQHAGGGRGGGAAGQTPRLLQGLAGPAAVQVGVGAKVARSGQPQLHEALLPPDGPRVAHASPPVLSPHLEVPDQPQVRHVGAVPVDAHPGRGQEALARVRS